MYICMYAFSDLQHYIHANNNNHNSNSNNHFALHCHIIGKQVPPQVQGGMWQAQWLAEARARNWNVRGAAI